MAKAGRTPLLPGRTTAETVPVWVVLFVLIVPLAAAGAVFGALPPAPAGEASAMAMDVPDSVPADAPTILEACRLEGQATVRCATTQLMAVLRQNGSDAAFDMLEDLARIDPLLNAASHPVAHELGIHALDVHGSVQNTLATCSYKVFAGCFHGALQAYFVALERVDASAVHGVCPTGDAFREYTCLHGLGHGLMLSTNYDLNFSLTLCSSLATRFAESSCAGGVFMENFAGWQEAQDPTASAVHQHLGTRGREPRYWIDPLDLNFPCSIVAAHYRWDCWFFHTSVVLYLNGVNFTDVTERCSAIEELAQDACFKSVGRDASSYKVRDPVEGGIICMAAGDVGRGLCAKGFVADSVVAFADPRAGLPVCLGFPAPLKLDCYHELAVQGRSIAPQKMAAVCAEVETAFAEACRQAGGVSR